MAFFYRYNLCIQNLNEILKMANSLPQTDGGIFCAALAGNCRTKHLKNSLFCTAHSCAIKGCSNSNTTDSPNSQVCDDHRCRYLCKNERGVVIFKCKLNADYEGDGLHCLFHTIQSETCLKCQCDTCKSGYLTKSATKT